MKARPASRARVVWANGFSLIELLVSMVIALVVTLAITSVLLRTEGSKRSTTSVNDVNQTGAYTAFVLDRAIRNAGSGFSQSWSTVYGCRLSVSKGGAAVLPFPTAIDSKSAFASITAGSGSLPIRMAPVIIAKGFADTKSTPVQVRGDVLMVMGGTGGGGESQQAVQEPIAAGATNVTLQNAMGYLSKDLFLLADTGVPGGCMVQQVGARASRSAPGTALPLASAYTAAGGSPVQLTDFGINTIALQLGSEVNPPQLQLFGVGNNNTLFSMDLLAPVVSGMVPDVPVADGIVEMRALYGIDNNPLLPDGKIDAWVEPEDAYAASALTDGSDESKKNLRKIVAIRIGLILRTSLQERSADYKLPDGTVLKLFGDLSQALWQTRALSGTELNYRYRTVEVTIPLRNVLLAPQT